MTPGYTFGVDRCGYRKGIEGYGEIIDGGSVI